MQLPYAPPDRQTPAWIERPSLARPRAAAYQQQTDFVETLRKLWRRRKIVIGSTLALAVVSIAAAYALRPSYSSESQVQIGVPELRVFSTDEMPAPPDPDAAKVDSERVAMMSRTVAKDVIDRLNLTHDPVFEARSDSGGTLLQRLDPRRWLPSWMPGAGSASSNALAPLPEERVIDSLLNHVFITRLGRSQVLEIDVSAPRADLAASIANTWAAVYLKDQRSDRVETSDRIDSYLKGRIADLRSQVETADRAVEDYRKQNGLYSGANASVTSQQVTELNTQLTLAETAKAQADAQLHDAEKLRSQGGDATDETSNASDSDPSVLDSHMVQSLKEQQAEAEQNLAQLQTTFGDRYPAVIKAKAEVADIRRKLSTEVARTIDSLRNAAQTADIRYATLQKNFDALQSHMGEVNEKDVRLEALQRDATVDRNLLEAMLNRAGETMGRQDLETPDAKLVSPAAVPYAPDFPPKKLIVLLGTMGGGLLGVLLALMYETGDRTLRRTEDVLEATGLPLIASVPNVSGRIPPAAHVLRHPVSPFSEALRKVYIRTLLSGVRELPKTVLITSSVPAEGKSVLAASLARLLAWNGKRVMVVDCDWRSPMLHRIFQCTNRTGLATVMADGQPDLQDLIFNDQASGADVMSAGNWTPRTAHMMASERMSRMISTFSDNYDMVILDGPPVLAGPEVLPLARMVDKTLFVVRWGHTKSDAVLDAVRQLADVEADVAGAVFSRVDPKRYRQFTYSNLDYSYVRGEAA